MAHHKDMSEPYEETEPLAAIIFFIILLVGFAFAFGFFSGMFYERTREDAAAVIHFEPYISQPRIVPEYEVEKVLAVVTAYSSTPDQTFGNPFVTASGARVRPGTIACPARLPFGTEIVLEGQNFTCEDRMAKRYRYGEYYDIWKDNYQEAVQWGRQTIEITVLN